MNKAAHSAAIMDEANGDSELVSPSVTPEIGSTRFEVLCPTLTHMRPLGSSILVKRIPDPINGPKSKIIVPGDEDNDKSPWAVAVMVGPGAYVTNVDEADKAEAIRGAGGVPTPLDAYVQRIHVGDLLLIKSFGGTEFRLASHSLIFIKPEHVLAVFQKEAT